MEQLKADVKHLQSSVRNLGYRTSAKDQEEKEREQLLSMRFTTNAAANSQSETSILIDRALEHNNALNVSLSFRLRIGKFLLYKSMFD